MGKTFNTGRLGNGLFVDANGNVGIGTSAPTEKLSVIGNIRIDNGAADGGQLVLASLGYSDWNIDSYNGSLRAYYGASVAMSISSSLAATFNGNVGIGGAPQERLSIQGPSGVAGMIRWTDGVTASAFIGMTSGGLPYIHSNNTSLAFGANGSNNFSETMRIISGVLSIGSSSPEYATRLYVQHDNSTAYNPNTFNGSNTLMTFKTANATNAFCAIRFAGGGAHEGLFGTVQDSGGLANFIWQSYASDGYRERMRIAGSTVSINGTFNQQGVQRVCYAGSIQGNQSITVTVTHANQSSFTIHCVMNHYGLITGYGCAKMSFLANGPGFTEVVVSDTTSGNGGAWQFARIDANNFTITKTAGSYGGGGNFMIEVVGNYIVGIS